MSQQNQDKTFREDARAWIKINFPTSLAGKDPTVAGYAAELESDHDLWRQRLADKGWGHLLGPSNTEGQA